MSTSVLLRAAIATAGFVISSTPLAFAAAPHDGTSEPAVATSVPVYAQNCRYKPLPGSHIKVQVCTSKEGAEYRMDRRARTIAVVIQGMPVSDPVPAPLPQVQ
jgi:hypothetical protein